MLIEEKKSQDGFTIAKIFKIENSYRIEKWVNGNWKVTLTVPSLYEASTRATAWVNSVSFLTE